MRVEELRHFSELEAIRTPWHELAEVSAHDSPYVLPEFLLPWIRRLGERYACRALAAWDGDVLVGLAPMVERRIGRFGLSLAMRIFPEVIPSPPCDILVRRGLSGVEESFLAHWMAQQDWDAIEFANAPRDSPAIARLGELAATQALHVQCTPSLEIYYVPVSTSWEDYLASRTKKMRQNLRRGQRYLERLGVTRFLTYPGDLTRAEALEQVAHVLAHSWKDHEDGPRGWNAFVRDLIGELDSGGLLTLRFLTVAGRAVAYLVDVPFKGSVYAMHNGYDLRVQPGNPGQLMLARAVEDAHHRAALRYVMGNRDYLQHWTTLRRPFQRVRICRRSPAAWLKLRAYDWIHTRRAQRALREVDLVKDARKHDLRDAGGPDDRQQVPDGRSERP